MATTALSRNTDRLRLDRPTPSDLDALFEICSDERVWTHYPSLRHTDTERTAGMMRRWNASWDKTGLGVWTVRDRADDTVLGYGGCTYMGDGDDAVWNLGYRIAADAQGRGYATEVSRAAIVRARSTLPDVPVIAYLLAHNTASAHVAEKVGFTLVHSGPDAGNPDPTAVRLVYADRPLTPGQLRTALR